MQGTATKIQLTRDERRVLQVVTALSLTNDREVARHLVKMTPIEADLILRRLKEKGKVTCQKIACDHLYTPVEKKEMKPRSMSIIDRRYWRNKYRDRWPKEDFRNYLRGPKKAEITLAVEPFPTHIRRPETAFERALRQSNTAKAFDALADDLKTCVRRMFARHERACTSLDCPLDPHFMFDAIYECKREKAKRERAENS